MALTVGVLKVSLRADANPLFQGLSGALKAVESFAKKTKEMAGNVAASAGALTAATAAATALAATVDGRTAVAVEGLRKDTAHFAVQVADLLAPAMKEMGALFRQAANVVAGLSPELKRSIGHFAEVAAAVAFAAKGVQLLMGVVAPAAQALSAFFGLFAGVSFTALATGLVEVVAVLGLVIGAVVLVHKAWRENWGGIQEKTGAVLQTIRGWWTDFVNFLKKGYDFLIDAGLAWVKGLLAGLDAMRGATGVGPSEKTVEGLRMGFEGLARDLKSGAVFTDAWKAVAAAGQDALSVVQEEFRRMVAEFGADKAWEKLKGKVQSIFTGGGPARMEQEFQDIFQNFQNTAADAFVHAIREGGAELKKLAGQLWDTFQRNPLAMGRQQRQQAYATARQEYDSGQAGVGEPTWELGLKALDAAGAQAATFGQQAGLWFKRMAGILQSSLSQVLGEVGNIINSAIQGAQAGGVWGAIAAVFLNLLAKTQSVQRFAGAALDAVGQIVAALEPVVAPIMDALMKLLGPIIDIFKTIFDVLGPFFQQIAGIITALVPVFKLIGTVLKFLGPILQAVFVVIGTIVGVIMSIILPIVAAIQELTGQHLAAADTMRSLDELWTAIGAPVASSANGAATGLDAVAAASEHVVESLMNVPEGYKVNEARFQAAIAEGDYTMPGSTTPGMPGSGSGSTYTPPPITFNGDLVVQAQDPEDLLAQLHARVVRINGQRYGTPMGAP